VYACPHALYSKMLAERTASRNVLVLFYLRRKRNGCRCRAGRGGRYENDKCRVSPLSLPLRPVAVDAASSSQHAPPGWNIIQQRTHLSNFIHRGRVPEPATSSARTKTARARQRW